ncbi:ankyrin repeat domain-containing protein [Planctomycetota bacterium]|nr:ankyrin repeat domain-containing protein [Planctomycetota bacterium]
MTQSINFLDLIAAEDLHAIKNLISQHPQSVHTHMAYDRPWGEELWLPIHHAVRLHKTEIVQLLIDLGSNVNGRTRFQPGPTKARATALHIAVTENQPDIARILLNSGAELHARKADGASPRDMIQALLDAGQSQYQPFLELINEFEAK